MRNIFVFLLAIWPLGIFGAEASLDTNAQFDKSMGAISQYIKGVDPAELEALMNAQQEPVMLALLLGRLGAYPIPEQDQGAASANRWPLTGIKDSFKIAYPYVLRVSVVSRDGTYPQRILMFRQENQNSPWVITDHFVENSDGSIKEKLAIPSPELQAKARAAVAADLLKRKECDDVEK
jgi:hypothetical protein